MERHLITILILAIVGLYSCKPQFEIVGQGDFDLDNNQARTLLKSYHLLNNRGVKRIYIEAFMADSIGRGLYLYQVGFPYRTTISLMPILICKNKLYFYRKKPKHQKDQYVRFRKNCGCIFSDPEWEMIRQRFNQGGVHYKM
jgi:hypothetical protein